VFNEASEHPLDKKFRVFVPKRLQENLPRDGEGNLPVVLTRGEDGCLYLFSEEGFKASIANLDTRAFTTRKQRMNQRRVTKDATRSCLDASGRLLIGPKQRSLIELKPNGEGKTTVVLLGVMNRIEIWPLHRWQEMEAQIDAAESELVEEEG